MAEDTPHSPRRRLSTDTMSTVDIPAPPYGLVDATQRPGSILDVPLSSGRGESAPLVRSGYRIRVGKLEIRSPSLWESDISDYQLLDVGPVNHVHSPKLTGVLASFENAIRLGHTLLILLRPYMDYRRYADIDLLYFKLGSLWKLCTTVGATLCNYEGVLPQYWEEYLCKKMSWICENVLANFIEKVQQVRVPTGTDVASNVPPAARAAQLKLVRSFARNISNDFSERNSSLETPTAQKFSVLVRYTIATEGHHAELEAHSTGAMAKGLLAPAQPDRRNAMLLREKRESTGDVRKANEANPKMDRFHLCTRYFARA